MRKHTRGCRFFRSGVGRASGLDKQDVPFLLSHGPYATTLGTTRSSLALSRASPFPILIVMAPFSTKKKSLPRGTPSMQGT